MGDTEGRPRGPRPDRRGPARARDALVVVLALTTGAVDAVTYLRLGRVFGSVITGNLALLGVAAGLREGSQAVSGGVALAGYALGVLAGSAVAGPKADEQPVWPARATLALGVELLVLAGFSGGWLAAAGTPSGTMRLVLLAVAAGAMGVQSAAVRLLGQMSSTYLTSTLTGVLEALAHLRVPKEWQRSAGVLVALVAGAALGAAAAMDSVSLAPVAILVPLAAVILCAAARFWPVSEPQRVPQGGVERHGEHQVDEPESGDDVEKAQGALAERPGPRQVRPEADKQIRGVDARQTDEQEAERDVVRAEENDDPEDGDQ
ncbi:MAG TPA: YoaK family protein [Trebonia sp.]|nr:YoaK family protein [Trebonia sp.]